MDKFQIAAELAKKYSPTEVLMTLLVKIPDEEARRYLSATEELLEDR